MVSREIVSKSYQERSFVRDRKTFIKILMTVIVLEA
jgi:hypothetical protein